MDSTMAAGTYYAMLYPANSTYGVYTSDTVDNVSFFSFDGSAWYDLNTYTFSTSNPLYSWPSNSQFNGPGNLSIITNTWHTPIANIVPTAIGSDWSIDSHVFTEPSTLDMSLTATEMKPFVMEIDVESEMEQITLTEEVLNSITERDWIGFGFQLGYWDEQNQRFVASTAGDGLDFGYSTSTEFGPMSFLSEDHIRFPLGSDLVEPGETASFALLINLPGGSDNFTFALQQYAVPEPSTFLLLAMSGVMMLLCGRRRR